MEKERLYISTTASDAAVVARQYGLGIEIAEYCTAWNMDAEFQRTDLAVERKLSGVCRRTFHAPFNELFPCAIDPKARRLAEDRYRQAIRLAKHYGADRIVIHGGYHPMLYYPVWYVEQSVAFWKNFLQDDPGILIVLENVLETEPEMLLDILQGVDAPGLGMCLDIGHVNAYSKRPAADWLACCAPYIRHFHIHNNDGSGDTHSPLFRGSIPIQMILEQAAWLCPEATYTLELIEAAPSVHWLIKHGVI